MKEDEKKEDEKKEEKKEDEKKEEEKKWNANMSFGKEGFELAAKLLINNKNFHESQKYP